MTGRSAPIRQSIPLTVAFAALLLVIGGSAFAIRYGAETEQRETDALHSMNLKAGNTLASIRANVFLGGILTRDYLLDSDSGHSVRYAEQFEAIRLETDRSFQALATAARSDGERQALARLHAEVSAYWDPTKTILNWTEQQKGDRRAGFLQDRVRHRAEIVELAGQVERLMAVNFAAERSRLTSAEQKFDSVVVWTTAIALLVALVISAITVGRLTSLERRAAMDEEELCRLSGQIRSAQERERGYLSRELHDQVGQMLTGLRMELASISQDAGREEVSERVSHAKGIAEQCLRSVRHIATMLRPSMLDDLGLAAAIGWLVRDMERSSGISIEADIDPALERLPDAYRTCIYRVVQEAVTNAARHSGAVRITVVLTAATGLATGRIVDDGCGFEASANRQAGLGLVGMEERMRELGGNLRVHSAPENGARIEFDLPCPTLETAGLARTA